ncbi:MAG: LCP family protein [Clostridia bacterium]
MKNLKITGIIGFLFQFIFSVVTVVFVIKLNMLPAFYIFWIVFILTLLLLISGIFIIARSKLRVIIGMVFAFLMSIVFAVVSIKYLIPAIGLFDTITKPTTTYKTTYHVLVKKDDNAQKIEDIVDYKIGVEKSHDFEAMKKALDNLAAKFSHTLNVTAYDDYTSMWNAFLNNGETGAVLMDTSFYNIYANSYQDQEDNIENYVRILDEIEVEMQKSNPTDSGKATPQGSLTERPFILYLSGIDVSGSINTRSRSDVNIIMAVNPNTHKILLVTVPRDTYVPLPGVTGGQYDKLTHAAIYGENDCAVSIATLEQNIYTGIHIDHWIRVNFTSLEKIVDALGGIEAYSEYSYTSHFTGEPVYFQKGMNYMDGWKALVFCRERKSIPGEEPQRGRNQLEVVKGIFNKATSPSIILNYNDVLNEVKDNFLTDMSMEDITGLVKMQIANNVPWTFETASVEVDYIYDYCYSMKSQKLCVGVMKEASRQEAINKINAVMNG